MSGIVNWVINSLAGEDFIERYFVLTDLVDVHLTEEEISEVSCYDSLANATAGGYQADSNIPTGKIVV